MVSGLEDFPLRESLGHLFSSALRGLSLVLFFRYVPECLLHVYLLWFFFISGNSTAPELTAGAPGDS